MSASMSAPGNIDQVEIMTRAEYDLRTELEPAGITDDQIAVMVALQGDTPDTWVVSVWRNNIEYRAQIWRNEFDVCWTVFSNEVCAHSTWHCVAADIPDAAEAFIARVALNVPNPALSGRWVDL